MLAGRVALVTGGDAGFGRELALGLADAGATVATTGGFASRAAATTALADAAAAYGPVDLVVHAHVDPEALTGTALSDTDAPAWERRCEALLREALWCAQAAFAAFTGTGHRDRSGDLVFVTPTVALSGAAGLVPYSTAVEGIRAMAKGAARQWGGHGIRVNCVAPPVEVVGAAGPGPWLAPVALERAPDPRADVAPAVALLASDAAHFVTGTTLVVDGGILMTP